MAPGATSATAPLDVTAASRAQPDWAGWMNDRRGYRGLDRLMRVLLSIAAFRVGLPNLRIAT
jgi:hypothetical protein